MKNTDYDKQTPTIIGFQPLQKLLSHYTIIARSLLKNYFLKEKTTPYDVANYSAQAIALINEIETVLEKNYTLTPLHQTRLKEITEMLTLFESSLVATRQTRFNPFSFKVAC